MKVKVHTLNDGQEIVRWSAGYAAGASIIPLPFLDMASLMAVQVTMVRRLAKLHDVSLDRTDARTLLLNALGSVVPPGVTATGIPLALKAVPGIGIFLGGLVAPASAAAVTLALGAHFNRRFAEEAASRNYASLEAHDSKHSPVALHAEEQPKQTGHSPEPEPEHAPPAPAGPAKQTRVAGAMNTSKGRPTARAKRKGKETG